MLVLWNIQTTRKVEASTVYLFFSALPRAKFKMAISNLYISLFNITIVADERPSMPFFCSKKTWNERFCRRVLNRNRTTSSVALLINSVALLLNSTKRTACGSFIRERESFFIDFPLFMKNEAFRPRFPWKVENWWVFWSIFHFSDQFSTFLINFPENWSNYP